MSLRHQFTFRGRSWVITKKNPANAPEMKKFSKLAKSRTFTTKVRSEQENSSRLHHRTHPLCKVIGLFRSSNLQVAISRVKISVLREELKGKSSRHLCSLKLMMCFLIGPGRTDMCSFYIYTSQYLRELFSTLRYCLFSLGKYLGQQITHLTFIATYSLTYTKCALPVQVLCCAFTEKRAIDLFTNYNTRQLKMIQQLLKTLNLFFFQKGELGGEKPTSLLLEKKENSFIFQIVFSIQPLQGSNYGGRGRGEKHTLWQVMNTIINNNSMEHVQQQQFSFIQERRVVRLTCF